MNALELINMSDLELKRAIKFKRKHNKKCKGSYQYLVTPGSIGEGVIIKCLVCKKKKAITDYGCW